jgi:hypothetical protein
MRRILTMLGIGVLAGAGLVLLGFYLFPYIALWMMFGWLTW